MLVAAQMRRERRYPKAVELIADLLSAESEILISLLTLSESQWALAKYAYIDIFNQKSKAQFNGTIYSKWHERIFLEHGARMSSIGAMIDAWVTVGVSIEFVPQGGGKEVAHLVSDYMKNHKLSSADAAHLAAAVSHARSFVTTDSGFEGAASVGVEIVHID